MFEKRRSPCHICHVPDHMWHICHMPWIWMTSRCDRGTFLQARNVGLGATQRLWTPIATLVNLVCGRLRLGRKVNSVAKCVQERAAEAGHGENAFFAGGWGTRTFCKRSFCKRSVSFLLPMQLAQVRCASPDGMTQMLSPLRFNEATSQSGHTT